MGQSQSLDQVEILVLGYGAGKLILKYSQTLSMANSRPSDSVEIKVGRCTKKAHILGLLPTWAPGNDRFNIRQKKSRGLMFSSLRNKVVVILFDNSDLMTLEETKKYFNSWCYNLRKHAERVVLVGVSGGLELDEQRRGTRNRQRVTESKLISLKQSLHLEGLQMLEVNLDDNYGVQHVFATAGRLFYMHSSGQRHRQPQQPIVTMPFNIEGSNVVEGTPNEHRPSWQSTSFIIPLVEYYKLDSRPTGLCLVINNIDFTPSSLITRTGSDEDYRNIERVFTKFGFLMQEERNLTAQKMMSLLQRTAHHYPAFLSCVVVFILSHGRRSDAIQDVDGRLVSVQEVVQVFGGDQCPQMAGKPKLFFFQSCRGGYNMRGVQPAVDSGFDDSDDEDIPESPAITIPVMQDTLVGYSTAADHVAFRCPKKGSWYIQTLTKLLDKYGDVHDLDDILKMTTQQVGRRATADGYKMCPDYKSNLVKHLRFSSGQCMYSEAPAGGYSQSIEPAWEVFCPST